MRPLGTLACLALLGFAPLALAQAPATGRLLVATPALEDPEFSETVLLILVHQDEGSAAIFLNRPTWIDPAEAFPEVEGIEAYDGGLYFGGPVAPAELLTLFEHDGDAPDNVLMITERVFFSTNPEPLADIDFAALDRPRIRVYAGRAEWGPNQLAREIAAGSWRVLNADAETIFDEDPVSLWRRMPLVGDGVTASLE